MANARMPTQRAPPFLASERTWAAQPSDKEAALANLWTLLFSMQHFRREVCVCVYILYFILWVRARWQTRLLLARLYVSFARKLFTS